MKIDMDNIIKSASKLVLLTLVAVLAVLALVAGIHGVLAGTFNETEKTILAAFGSAITFVFGFYFSYKGEEKKTGQEDQAPASPYAGK